MNRLAAAERAARAARGSGPGARRKRGGRALVASSLLFLLLLVFLVVVAPAAAQPRCLVQQPACGADKGPNNNSGNNSGNSSNNSGNNKPTYQLTTPAPTVLDASGARAAAGGGAATTQTLPADELATATAGAPPADSLMDQLALMMQPRSARVLQQAEAPGSAAAASRLAAAEAERAEAAIFGASELPPPTTDASNGLFAFPSDLPREDEDTLRSYMRPRLPVAAGGQDLAFTADAREKAVRFAKEAAYVPNGNGNGGSNNSNNGGSSNNIGGSNNNNSLNNSRGPGAKNGTLFLSRGALRLGVDCARGATIFYLGLEGSAARGGERAAKGVPGDLLGKSLVNGYDCGRGLQQSYYGCWDGSCWPPGKSWLYNPVQCGSWTDKPSTVMRCEMLGSGSGSESSPSGTPTTANSVRSLIDADDADLITGPIQEKRQRIVTSVIPRNWGGGQLLPEVRMDSDIALSPKGEVARIRFSMTYGAEAARWANARIAAPPPHPLRMQEVPAVFVDRRLSSLVFYNRTKDRQWTDPWGKLTLARPRSTNDYFLPTERWAAYVFPGTGWGVGVYSPLSDVVTAYRVGPDPQNGKAPPTSDVSYFAPTVKFPLTPGQTYTYDVYVAVGSIGDLRAHFARIAERTGRAAAGSARAMAAAAEATTADVGERAAKGLVGSGGGGVVEGAPGARNAGSASG